jgi:hypothetical protein
LIRASISWSRASAAVEVWANATPDGAINAAASAHESANE